MPNDQSPFYTKGGTFTLSISTAPAIVNLTAGSPGSLLLTNLSTVAMQVLITGSGSSATTMSTLSTSGLVPGIVVSAGVSRQLTVGCPPAPNVSAMTTGTGLSGILAVTLGEGFI